MKTILYSCDGCGKQSDNHYDFSQVMIYRDASSKGAYDLCKECDIKIGMAQADKLKEIRKGNGR